MVRQRVYLSLGSNLGTREENIFKAIRKIKGFLDNTRMSRLYETRPLYIEDQPLFLNTVISGFTVLSPYRLLKECQSIESSLGRDRSREKKKGPRYLDIDILLYGDKVINTGRLVLPHQGIKERQFVLIPLLELDVEVVDPVTGSPYSDYLKRLADQGVYTYKSSKYNK